MVMPEIDLFTTAVLPLELFFNDLPLGHATGFLWRASATRQLYIVTNWHVVSAKDFFGKVRNMGGHIRDAGKLATGKGNSGNAKGNGENTCPTVTAKAVTSCRNRTRRQAP
jgi:hypothetical protein